MPHSSRLRCGRRQPLEELLPRADLDPDLLEVLGVEDLRGREVVDLVLVEELLQRLGLGGLELEAVDEFGEAGLDAPSPLNGRRRHRRGRRDHGRGSRGLNGASPIALRSWLPSDSSPSPATPSSVHTFSASNNEAASFLALN